MSKKHLEGDFKWLVGMYSCTAQDIYKVENTAIICLNIDNTGNCNCIDMISQEHHSEERGQERPYSGEEYGGSLNN